MSNLPGANKGRGNQQQAAGPRLSSMRKIDKQMFTVFVSLSWLFNLFSVLSVKWPDGNLTGLVGANPGISLLLSTLVSIFMVMWIQRMEIIE